MMVPMVWHYKNRAKKKHYRANAPSECENLVFSMFPPFMQPVVSLPGFGFVGAHFHPDYPDCHLYCSPDEAEPDFNLKNNAITQLKCLGEIMPPKPDKMHSFMGLKQSGFVKD